jgi:hypothetical protein
MSEHTSAYAPRHYATTTTAPRRVIRSLAVRLFHAADEILIVLTLHVAAVALYYKFGEPVVNLITGGH